ncbi:YALIA101S04e01156g1_1 [Yarrowia lipolytica]|uniref:Uncharacterized protein n=1 Tax=Yarrowia lipolytica TaxID=4952 RepID=A0A371C337_YARLL|nr:Hypothetical protein YALI2_B00307g [Yarrowia lipolytica]RDW24745.1 hypothetical protein B0I71DRAFT_175807 [Yarrowia lipolytica]SEI33736.1 YALIA101S04e01156g1_1 [Yarrowia lipolytica]VBB89767.1 Hypothetical protein conserved in the Yarrowia clade [Yarrowia lipolytica]
MYRSWNNESDEANTSTSSVPPFGATNFAAFSPQASENNGNLPDLSQTDKTDNDEVTELIVSDYSSPVHDTMAADTVPTTSSTATSSNDKMDIVGSPDTTQEPALVTIRRESVNITRYNGVVIEQSIESQTFVMTEQAGESSDSRIEEIIESTSEDLPNMATPPQTAIRPDLFAPVVRAPASVGPKLEATNTPKQLPVRMPGANMPWATAPIILPNPQILRPLSENGEILPRKAVVVRKPHGVRQVAPAAESQKKEEHASQPEHSQSRYVSHSVHVDDIQDQEDAIITSNVESDAPLDSSRPTELKKPERKVQETEKEPAQEPVAAEQPTKSEVPEQPTTSETPEQTMGQKASTMEDQEENKQEAVSAKKFPATVKEAEAAVAASLRAERAKTIAKAMTEARPKAEDEAEQSRKGKVAAEKTKAEEKSALDKRHKREEEERAAGKKRTQEGQAARDKRVAKTKAIARERRAQPKEKRARDKETEERRAEERLAREKNAKEKRMKEEQKAAAKNQPEAVILIDDSDDDEAEEQEVQEEEEDTLVEPQEGMEVDGDANEDRDVGQGEVREQTEIELDENGIPTDPKYGVDFTELLHTEAYKRNMEAHRRWSKSGISLNVFLIRRKKEKQQRQKKKGREETENEEDEDKHLPAENYCDFSELVKTKRYRKNMEEEGYVLNDDNEIIKRRTRGRSDGKTKKPKTSPDAGYDKTLAAEQAKKEAKAAVTKRNRLTRAQARAQRKEMVSNDGASTSTAAVRPRANAKRKPVAEKQHFSSSEEDALLSMSEEFPAIIPNKGGDEDLKQIKRTKIDDPECLSGEKHDNAKGKSVDYS